MYNLPIHNDSGFRLVLHKVPAAEGRDDPTIENLKQEPIVNLLGRSTIKRNLEITMYNVHIEQAYWSFVGVVIWKILLVQVESI